jgi:lysosomal Pro-X carboxypeptidase
MLTDCNLQLTSQSESLNCFNVIKATWDVLEERGSNDKGLLELSKMFRACK